MALYELRQSARYEVVALLTTVASEFDRVSHHGVRVELLERQAAAVGVALNKLYLPRDRCTNEEYEALMERTMREYCEAGVSAVAFGDIFLEDLRAYRERNLARAGMRGVFPIWHPDTTYLACVDGTKLGRGFAGRAIDGTLLRDLPAEVDPCGENGEFHSFVYNGPIFRRPVPVTVGEVVARDIRYFADLLPADRPGAE